MSQKDELKPCPYCGEVYDIYVHELNDPTTWWDSAVRGSHCFVVQCAACGVSIKGETKEEAVRHWNQRQQDLWIPVKKKLPRIDKNSDDPIMIIGTFKGIDPRSGSFRYVASDWVHLKDGRIELEDHDIKDLVAWMPWPDEYKKDKERDIVIYAKLKKDK